MSEQARINDELAHLRDGVVGAIRDGRLLDAERGLAVYRRLFRAVADELVPVEAGPIDVNDLREWRWMRQGLYEISAVAAESGDREVRLVADACLDMTSDAIESGHPAALTSLLSAYSDLWTECLSAQRSDTVFRTMTVQLANLCDLVLPGRPEREGMASDDVRQLIVDLMVDLVRLADTEHPQVAAIAADALLGLGRVDMADDPVRARVRAGVLTLYAWHLLLAQRDAADEAAIARSEARAMRIDRENLLTACRDALSALSGLSSRWSQWEFELLNRRSALLELNDYVLRATAAVAVRKGIDLPSQYTSENRSLVDQLLGKLPSVDAKSALGEKTTVALSEWLVAYERYRRESLAEQPLDADRIEAFGRAVEGAFQAETPPLVRYLMRQAPMPEHSEGEQVGYRVHVPREYFVPLPGYHYEPDELARDLVRGLFRAQEERLVALVSEGTEVRTSHLNDLAGGISSYIQEQDIRQPLILINNTSQAWQQIGADEVGAVSLPDGSRADAVIVYTDDDDMWCLVLDLKREGSLDLLPPSDPSLHAVSTGAGWSVSEPSSPQDPPSALVVLIQAFQWRPAKEPVRRRFSIPDAEW